MYEDSAFDPYNQLSHEMAFSKTLLGRECQSCRRALPYSVYDKDSSTRDGRALICPKCLSTPRLSAAENYSRQREANFASEAVCSQRRPDEEDYIDRDYVGKQLYGWQIVEKLKIAGLKIIAGPAAFLDEISLYIEDYSLPSGALYVGWISKNVNPEFSTYSYNDYAVPTGELDHGYRGVLRNLILNGYLSEKKCNKIFGDCHEKTWGKSMWNYRNPGVPCPE